MTETAKVQRLQELDSLHRQEMEVAVAQVEAEGMMEEEKVSEQLNHEMLEQMKASTLETLNKVRYALGTGFLREGFTIRL